METLRNEAINIIKKLPDYNMEYTVNILKNIRDMSLENAKHNLSKEEAWASFMEGINGFTDDFMADGRSPDYPSPREEL